MECSATISNSGLNRHLCAKREETIENGVFEFFPREVVRLLDLSSILNRYNLQKINKCQKQSFMSILDRFFGQNGRFGAKQPTL